MRKKMYSLHHRHTLPSLLLLPPPPESYNTEEASPATTTVEEVKAIFGTPVYNERH